MSDTVVVALISTSGTLAVAVTALALNFVGHRSLERRIERVEEDLKQFFTTLADHDKRISRQERP